MQRVAGTLRARPARGRASLNSIAVRARALPVRGGRHATRKNDWSSVRRARLRDSRPTRRSIFRWTCCSANRRGCIATRRIRAAALADVAGTVSLDCASRRACCASVGRREVFLVTIGDRTRRRTDLARPDGRAVAAAGRRLRGHARRFRRLRRRSDGDGRTHAARAARCGRSRTHGGGRDDHQSCAAPVGALDRIKLSANWMAAVGHAGEDARCSTRCKAVGMELCPRLEVPIPVGKDSLSMQAQWPRDGARAQVGVAGFADRVRVRAGRRRARAARRRCCPRRRAELWLIGLGAGRQRLGGSILAQCFDGFGGAAPDLDDPRACALVRTGARCARSGLLLAYHDRSDGGAFAALCEMAFCSHLRPRHRARRLGRRSRRGRVPHAVQRGTRRGRADRGEDRAEFADLVARHGLVECAQRIARPTTAPAMRVHRRRQAAGRMALGGTVRCMVVGDACDADAARQSRKRRRGTRHARAASTLRGCSRSSTFDPADDIAAPFIDTGARPRVAVLREQGVNGQVEMAAAFERAAASTRSTCT